MVVSRERDGDKAARRTPEPKTPARQARFPSLQGAQTTLVGQTQIGEDEVLRCERCDKSKFLIHVHVPCQDMGCKEEEEVLLGSVSQLSVLLASATAPVPQPNPFCFECSIVGTGCRRGSRGRRSETVKLKGTSRDSWRKTVDAFEIMIILQSCIYIYIYIIYIYTYTSYAKPE